LSISCEAEYSRQALAKQIDHSRWLNWRPPKVPQLTKQQIGMRALAAVDDTALQH
jgi:hypothetical protein